MDPPNISSYPWSLISLPAAVIGPPTQCPPPPPLHYFNSLVPIALVPYLTCPPSHCPPPHPHPPPPKSHWTPFSLVRPSSAHPWTQRSHILNLEFEFAWLSQTWHWRSTIPLVLHLFIGPPSMVRSERPLCHRWTTKATVLPPLCLQRRPVAQGRHKARSPCVKGYQLLRSLRGYKAQYNLGT